MVHYSYYILCMYIYGAPILYRPVPVIFIYPSTVHTLQYIILYLYRGNHYPRGFRSICFPSYRDGDGVLGHALRRTSICDDYLLTEMPLPLTISDKRNVFILQCCKVPANEGPNRFNNRNPEDLRNFFVERNFKPDAAKQ